MRSQKHLGVLAVALLDRRAEFVGGVDLGGGEAFGSGHQNPVLRLAVPSSRSRFTTVVNGTGHWLQPRQTATEAEQGLRRSKRRRGGTAADRSKPRPRLCAGAKRPLAFDLPLLHTELVWLAR